MRCGNVLRVAQQRTAASITRPAATPGPWGGAGTFLAGMVATMLVGTVLATALVPGFRGAASHAAYSAVTAVRRALGAGYAPVRPVQATASSQLSGHEARLAIDLVSDDYWAADAADAQPVLYLRLASPSDLNYVIFTSGAGPDFGRLARPRQVQLYYSDGTSETLTLRDDPRPAGYDLSARSVTTVAVRVVSTYPGSDSQSVAIAEVELFRLG